MHEEPTYYEEYPQELRYKAVVFDLDGVITQTAHLHERVIRMGQFVVILKAWKQVFDEFLQKKPNFSEFSHTDYLKYVDGLPRAEGAAKFLESRGFIVLCIGNNMHQEFPLREENSPILQKRNFLQVCWLTPRDTIYGIGHRKDKIFNSIIETEKIPVYESTVNFIKQLKERGIKIAVASSSKHCRQVLRITGTCSIHSSDGVELEHYFDANVDGIVTEGLKLHGKPAPDIFTKCCELLRVSPEESIMLEDAISGVQAGRNVLE